MIRHENGSGNDEAASTQRPVKREREMMADQLALLQAELQALKDAGGKAS